MSSPRKNIIRSCQAQHRQGAHTQNSSSCPATWSPGYGLLDHKALLKAPAAPLGTRPAAAARRLVLTSSKQTAGKARQSPQKLPAAPAVPRVTKSFLRQRFQASQNLLLNACSLTAASASSPSAATTTTTDTAMIYEPLAAAAAANSISTTSKSEMVEEGHSQDAAAEAAATLLLGSPTVAQPASSLCSPTAQPAAEDMPSTAGAPDAAAQRLSGSAAGVSCKPASFAKTFRKLKIDIPNPPAVASSSNAPIKIISSPGSALCSVGEASSAFSTMMMQSSMMRSSQLYPPDVAAPAQLGWDTPTPTFSSPSSCKSDGCEAAVLAGQPLPASEDVAATALQPCATEAAAAVQQLLRQQQLEAHNRPALLSEATNSFRPCDRIPAAEASVEAAGSVAHVHLELHSSMYGDLAGVWRVAEIAQDTQLSSSSARSIDGQPTAPPAHAAVTTSHLASANSSGSSPASTIASRLKSSTWLAAGGDAGATRDPVLAASAMYGALIHSFEDAYPEYPRTSMRTARKRWQAAGAAIIFQKQFRSNPCLQDEAAMQAELLSATVLGPSNMVELWLDYARSTNHEQQQQQQEEQQQEEEPSRATMWRQAKKAVAAASTQGLVPAAEATVNLAGSVAHVHLELDSSMFGVLGRHCLLDHGAQSSSHWCAGGTASAGCCSSNDSVASRLYASGRTSVQSPLPAGLVIANQPTTAPTDTAGTAVDGLTASSSSSSSSKRARKKTAGLFSALLNRKARKQDATTAVLPAPIGHSSMQEASTSQLPSTIASSTPYINDPNSAGSCSSSRIDHESPMAVATVAMSGSVAQVHLDLSSIMSDLLAGANTPAGADMALYLSHVVRATGLQRSGEGSAAAAAAAAAVRGTPAGLVDEQQGEPEAAGAAQPMTKLRVLTDLAEWEALFEQQVEPRSPRQRRRCCRGGPPADDGSDSSSDDDVSQAEGGFIARAVQEPACEGAVPAAAASFVSDHVAAVGLDGSGNSSSRGSTADGCTGRDGSFTVPEQEEEEAEIKPVDYQEQKRQVPAAGTGLRSWWQGRVSRSFRKAATGIFGLPGSSSIKALQVDDNADAVARASADAATTEEEEVREVEEAHTRFGGTSAAGGQSGAGRVGYLTKLFSIRSRRDVLLAAGDQ